MKIIFAKAMFKMVLKYQTWNYRLNLLHCDFLLNPLS